MKKRELEKLYKAHGNLKKTAAAMGVGVLVARGMILDAGIQLNQNNGRVVGTRTNEKSPGYIQYIDRGDLVAGYNNQYGANYKCMKDLLIGLYSKEQKSIMQVGKILGLAHTTVQGWMVAYGIPRRAKGRGTTVSCLRVLRSLGERSDQVDSAQIAKKYGLTSRWVRTVARKNNIKIKDLKPDARKSSIYTVPKVQAQDEPKSVSPVLRPGRPVPRVYRPPKTLKPLSPDAGCRSCLLMDDTDDGPHCGPCALGGAA